MNQREQDTTKSELIAALDADGKPLAQQVSRFEAHHRGIWHRAISVFVVNRYGEILVERRSMKKDLFPGCYDIVGGHVQHGETPLKAAVEEIREELGQIVATSRLEELAPEDSVIERVVLPDKGIVNLERKTVYLLRLNSAEEEAVFRYVAELIRLNPEELEARGAFGEVTQVQFWTLERLRDATRSSARRAIASGVLSALSDSRVWEAISECALALRSNRRREFATKYVFLDTGSGAESNLDRALFDLFLEKPTQVAPVEQVNAIFESGSEQMAGAYLLGAFRQVAAGDACWESKLRDPETRYVRNLLAAVGFRQEIKVRQKLDAMSSEIEAYVSELLNLPLADGKRFRDELGNLADIAAARRAVLVWLAHAMPDLPRAEILDYPTRAMSKVCIQAGRHMLETLCTKYPVVGFDRFRELVLVGLCASSADFNNPDFQSHMSDGNEMNGSVDRFLEQRTTLELARDLGGDYFISEFYAEFVKSGNQVRIAYLAGNTAQACISLAIAQEIMLTNGNAKVCFIAKSGSPGNDMTLNDANEILSYFGAGSFAALVEFQKAGRFTLGHEGPECHGLDPKRLSRSTSQSLCDADIILAEGQAYAEIRGWKKPTYISFRVNGRVAEAIHGVSRKRGACGFVRLTPGIDHFQDFESVIRRSLLDATDHGVIAVAGQTTAEYVRAVLSQNFDLIVRHIFQGSRTEACRQLRAEGDRLGKTFARVVIGAASDPPDAAEVTRAWHNMHFPVFACGGGGGFNSVTLRALRMLGLPTVAGVPSTDDGGSTGELQRWLRTERGFVFGVGDMAAILETSLSNRGKQAVLSYRFDREPGSLTRAVMERIVAEIIAPTYPDSPIGAADDFLSFICGQLNLARIIEQRFLRSDLSCRLPIKGASVRNLNIIAAYELCGILGESAPVDDESRVAAFHVLKEALGLPSNLLVVPVSYSEGVLYLEYEMPISQQLAAEFGIPNEMLARGRTRLYGQHYIDTLPQPGPRSTVGVTVGPHDSRRPRANSEYLSRLRKAELFVMGAGSLIGSQLSQFVIPGVVDILLDRSDMRRILVLNHVKMDETLGMSVRDQVRLIEVAATESASQHLVEKHAGAEQRLRIADLFSDIVVPRTVARELETEMRTSSSVAATATDVPAFVDIADLAMDRTTRIFCNKYVKFLLDNPSIREKYGVTTRELEVLSYLDQPAALCSRRSEGGRYRGAVFATTEDIEYLVARGIQRRSIHEVDSVGRNWKLVKAEGAPSLEVFPGLVPEALVGIFRIALERTSASTSE